jgi:TP901 family phage tail tape measure protein
MILRELLIKIGLDFDEKGLKKAEEKLGSVGKAAMSLATAFTASAVVQGATHLVNEVTHLADELGELGEAFGVGVEELQKLGFAAQMSGASAEALRGALSRLTRAASDAAQGNKEAQKTFSRLGISVTDSNGQLKGSDTLFREVADSVSRIDNPAKRAAIAIEIFGRDGARLGPLLAKGSAGIDKLGEELERLGGVMDEGFVKDSAEFRDNVDRFNASLLGLKTTIVKGLLPAADWLVRKGTEVTAFFRNALSNTRAVEASFLVLGAAAIALGIKMVLPFLPFIGMALLVGAALTAIILIVDDLWVALDGGDSVIGRAVQGLDNLHSKLALFESGNKWIDWYLVKPLQLVLFLVTETVRQFSALAQAATGNFGPLKAFLGEWGASFKEAIGGQKTVDFIVGTGSATPFRQVMGAGTPEGGAPFAGAFGPMDRGIPAMAGAGGVTNAPTFNMEIAVNGAPGTPPEALAVAVREQVDAALQAHIEDAYAALVPMGAQ